MPGDRWDEVIDRALAGAGLVVVLISRAGSKHDGWYAREEIARAIDDTRNDGKRIIPVKLDPDLNDRMPYGLRRVVAIDAHDRDWHRVADGIAAAIERRPVVYRAPARGWRAWLGRLLRFFGIGLSTEVPSPSPRGALPPSATTPITPTTPPAPPPALLASAPPSLALLRTQLRALHGTLVPFFQRADDPTTLDDIYVELALDRTSRLPDAGPRELTLEALMRGGDGHRRHGRWAILGEPGAGKSTLARHLVWQQAAPDAEPLALYIGLADWAEFAGDPFDFLEAELHRHHRDRAAGLADALRARAAERDPGAGPDRLWLIFDGFDEIAPAHVGATRDRIITFAADDPRGAEHPVRLASLQPLRVALALQPLRHAPDDLPRGRVERRRDHPLGLLGSPSMASVSAGGRHRPSASGVVREVHDRHAMDGDRGGRGVRCSRTARAPARIHARRAGSPTASGPIGVRACAGRSGLRESGFGLAWRTG